MAEITLKDLWNEEIGPKTKVFTEATGHVQRALYLSDAEDLSSARRTAKEINRDMELITTQVGEMSDHGTLISLLSSDDDEMQFNVLASIMGCLTGDEEWAGTTKGQISRGDLSEEEEEVEEVEDEEVEEPPAPPTPPGGAVEQIAALLATLGGGGGIDPAELTRIVAAQVKTAMTSAVTTLEARYTEAVNNLPPRDVIEIKKGGETRTIEGVVHKQFKEVLQFATTRRASGWPIMIWAYGGPGSGKTYMLSTQLGKALGFERKDIFVFPCGPTTTEGKVTGYTNVLSDTFREGFIYGPFKNGGLAVLDEADVPDGSVHPAINALDNDDFMFPNGETVKRHKDFHLICSANTLGTGAMNGFNRNRIDAAFLDRFVCMEIEYDPELERQTSIPAGISKEKIELCKRWLAYVLKVRDYVQSNNQCSIYITPRASMNGCALLANDNKTESVLKSVLFRHMSKQMVAAVTDRKNAGVFK